MSAHSHSSSGRLYCRRTWLGLRAGYSRSEARRQQSLLREWRGWGFERLDGLQQARQPRHRHTNVGALCKGLFEIVHAVGTIHDPTERLLPPQRPTGGKAAVEHRPYRRELASLRTSSVHSDHRWGCHPARRDHIDCILVRRSSGRQGRLGHHGAPEEDNQLPDSGSAS